MFHRFHDLKGGPGPQDPEMVNRSSSSSQVVSMGAAIYNSLLCSDDQGSQHVVQGSQTENLNQHPIPTPSPGPEYANQEGSIVAAQRQNVLTTEQKNGNGMQGSPYLPEHYRFSTNEPEQHFVSFNNAGERDISPRTIPNDSDHLKMSPHVESEIAPSDPAFQLSVEDQRNNIAFHREVTDLRRASLDYKRLSYDQQQHSSEHQLDAENYSVYSQKLVSNSKDQVKESQNHSMQYFEHQLLNSQRLEVNCPRYHLDTQKAKHGSQNHEEVLRISQSAKPQNLESSKLSDNLQIASKEAENQMVEIQRLTVGSHVHHMQNHEDSRKSMNIQNQVKSPENALTHSETSSNDHILNDGVNNKHFVSKKPERYLSTQSVRPILKQEIDGIKYYEKRVYDRKLQNGGKTILEHQMSKSLSAHQTAEQDLHGNYKTYGQYTEEVDDVFKQEVGDSGRVRQLGNYKSFETVPHVGNHETVCDNGSPQHNREVFSRTGEEDLDIIHNAIHPSPRLSKGKQPKQYICSICEMSFKNGTQLKNHAWRHTGEKPFSCETCHATFTQHSNLKTHMRIHTGERPYACQECSATFTQISNLRTHQKIHTGDKPFECDECGIKFSQQSNLKSHKLIHTGERPFQCTHCDASFVQSTHLRNHQRIHTDERPYPCEQCGAKFRQLSNLKTHEKIHTGERPHVCPNCGSAFAQRSNLKSHILKLHAPDGSSPSRRGRKKKLEPIKPHYCNICGAKFTLISNLKIHTRLHTGEKPFSCTTCDASFAQKSNLKSHEMTHTCMKPHQCDECGAAFRQKTNLRTHKLKKHSSVRSSRLKDISETKYETHTILNDTDHSPYNTSHF